MPDPHRFGVVALTGPPNAGKSTLLNGIVGKKISIMSRRPQTTRHRILGIKTLPQAQLVFVDTPGLHHDQPRNLNRAINRTAMNSLLEVDLIVFMIDFRGWTTGLEKLFATVAPAGDTPVVLLINKTDRLRDRERLLPIIEQSSRIHPFKAIIPLSARKPGDIEKFLHAIVKILPEGAPGFPADQHTDRSERFFASELVREQTFRQLGRELPYASAVEVTRFEYNDDKLLNVAMVIWVEKKSQKSIVVGHGGQKLKSIGERARKAMEKSFTVRVHLDLHVKVKKGWADNDAQLRAFGYLED